jgi:hypothetical protein
MNHDCLNRILERRKQWRGNRELAAWMARWDAIMARAWRIRILTHHCSEQQNSVRFVRHWGRLIMAIDRKTQCIAHYADRLCGQIEPRYIDYIIDEVRHCANNEKRRLP